MKITIIILLALFSLSARAQQFNTDNYITMPHGTGTFVLTQGQRNATMYSIFALLPGFELNFQANLFWEDKTADLPNRFTTNIFGKYMFWVNKQKNGGAAIFLGIGHSPSFYTDSAYSALHYNYWTAAPLTIPFNHGNITWDIMPGALVDFDYGNNKKTAWGYSYSSRIAVYKIIPKSAIVGEIYGTEGDVFSAPEYKAGIRWEPNSYFVAAASYGAALNGNKGAGFEIGVMIFTPQFLRKDFIKNNTITF